MFRIWVFHLIVRLNPYLQSAQDFLARHSFPAALADCRTRDLRASSPASCSTRDERIRSATSWTACTRTWTKERSSQESYQYSSLYDCQTTLYVLYSECQTPLQHGLVLHARRADPLGHQLHAPACEHGRRASPFVAWKHASVEERPNLEEPATSKGRRCAQKPATPDLGGVLGDLLAIHAEHALQVGRLTARGALSGLRIARPRRPRKATGSGLP